MPLRGFFGLLPVLLLLAVGPQFAGFLPAGPGSLFDIDAAAVSAAVVTLLFALFAWPALARDRDVRTVAGGALCQFGIAVPFVLGLGLARGTRLPAILTALVVVAGTILLAAVWLAGPGRGGRRDRVYAAFWVAVTVALPLANYALSDFLGSSWTLGYRLSPLLAVRRILLDLPGADPVPFLLAGAAFLAVAAAGRLSGRGAAAILLFGLAGAAHGAEVTPALGNLYVPGRWVPLRATPSVESAEIAIGLPGNGVWRSRVHPGGTLVPIPGVEGLKEVRVNGEPVAVDLRPAPAGRWLVALGPIPEGLSRAAREEGFVVSRAAPGWEKMVPALFDSPDGILDPGRALPRALENALRGRGVVIVRAAGDLPGPVPLRQPWEESGRILDPADLERMFGPAPGPDPERAQTAALILLLFGVSALTVFRFAARRGMSGVGSGLVLLPLAAGAVAALLLAIPGEPEVREETVKRTGFGTGVTIHRFHSRQATTVNRGFRGYPLILGRGQEVEVRVTPGSFLVSLPLRAFETRYVVDRYRSPAGAAPVEFDFFLTPDGLAKPGDSPEPPGEFLSRHYRGADGRTTPRGWILRKLLRLGGGIQEKYGVRWLDERHLEIRAVPE